MQGYILQLVRDKRADAADNSLAARIARARRDGDCLSEEDAVQIITQLFVAGNETTTSLITNFMMRMMDERYRWADFCAGKIDMTAAIRQQLATSRAVDVIAPSLASVLISMMSKVWPAAKNSVIMPTSRPTSPQGRSLTVASQ